MQREGSAFDLRIVRMDQVFPPSQSSWVNLRVGYRKREDGLHQFRYLTLAHNGERFARSMAYAALKVDCAVAFDALAAAGYPDSSALTAGNRAA